MSSPTTVKVGLTGGIGSGKSTVARLLSERGAFVVNADEIAREVVAPGTEGLAELVEAFGTGILNADGTLNRLGLAEVVFNDTIGRAALDTITHPRIAARTAEIMAGAPAGAVIVHDVPLLTELGLAPAYDFVIVVDAPEDVRIERLRQRGLNEVDARARIAAQATREQRLAIADAVLDNANGLDQLEAQVQDLWPRLAALTAPQP